MANLSVLESAIEKLVDVGPMIQGDQYFNSLTKDVCLKRYKQAVLDGLTGTSYRHTLYKFTRGLSSKNDRNLYIQGNECNLDLVCDRCQSIPIHDYLLNWPELAGFIVFWSSMTGKAVIAIVLPVPWKRSANFKQIDRFEYVSDVNGIQELVQDRLMEYFVMRTNNTTVTQRLDNSPGGLCYILAINTVLNELGCRTLKHSELVKFYQIYQNDRETPVEEIGKYTGAFRVTQRFSVRASDLTDLLKTYPQLKDQTFIIIGVAGKMHSNSDNVGIVSSHAIVYNGRTGLIKDYNLDSDMGALLPRYYDASELDSKAYGGGIFGTLSDWGHKAISKIGKLGIFQINWTLPTYRIVVLECTHYRADSVSDYIGMGIGPDDKKLGKKRGRTAILDEIISDMVEYRKKYHDHNIKISDTEKRLTSYSDDPSVWAASKDDYTEPNKWGLKKKKP